MSDTPRVDDEITKVQKIHAEKELDDVEHYMEMCASLSGMARQLERELAEAVICANELVHYGDPKPWRIEEWKKAKQKAIGFYNSNAAGQGRREATYPEPACSQGGCQ